MEQMERMLGNVGQDEQNLQACCLVITPSTPSHP